MKKNLPILDSNDVVEKTISLGYWKNLWKKINQKRITKWSLRMIYFLIFLSIFSDFIANERPLICKINNITYYPVFHEYAEKMGMAKPYSMLQKKDWNELNFDFKILSPIPYSTHSFDLMNVYKSPFSKQNIHSIQYRHWLGTSDLGKDVLSGLIHGTRTALMVGVLSMLLASLIGIVFGAFAGYFGDHSLKISRISILLNMLGLFFSIIYGFAFRKYGYLHGHLVVEFLKSLLICLFIMGVVNMLVFLFERNRILGKKVSLPLDLLLLRIIEIVHAIPLILILLASLSVINHPSIFNVILVIGFFRWTGIARYLRAELLKIRNLEYINAAKTLGLSRFRIIVKHALPNAISPILIIIAFGISGAILVEATLSFLGIGVGPDDMTWGQLLSYARNKPDAWWLAVFPGLAIFVTVTIFNLIGDALSDTINLRD